LPGLGSAAKLGKIGKSIAKIAPIIKGSLLAVGAISGVKGLENILSGEYSIDDFRNVANGLMAATGIGRKVGEVKASKLKGKTVDSSIDVVKSQRSRIDKFADANKNERNKALDEFIQNNPNYAHVG
jgi:hypothetical protein